MAHKLLISRSIRTLPLALATIRHLAVGALLLTGCAVGPNYQPPVAPHTNGYAPAGALPAVTSGTDVAGAEAQRFVDGLDIPGQWWTLFKSPELSALIERALANSPTLDAAQAALRQARETTAAERGGLFPSVSGQYQGEREKASGAQFGEPQLGSFLYTLNSATVNVSYTLDAFGGIRRQIEALDAQAQYERYSLEASYLALTANVVTAAVNEASLREQIRATEQIARAQQSELDITKARVKSGAASLTDVLQQQAALQSTLAALPGLRTELAEQRNQLAAYLGELPADYDGAAITLDSLTLPDELPVSVPSKLVEQRPDIQEFAALLHEATAQIGVATANMLPQLTLTADLGGVSNRFSNLFSPAASVWGLVGGVTQPLFKGGQLTHQRRASIAAAEQAAANYKSTVITAFQNVSNSLYALAGDADTLNAQIAAEKTAADALELIEAQYRSGAASHLQVLTAEQNYQTAVVSLVKARAQRLADSAALFQALGGGWWNRTDVAANYSDCCKGHK